MRRVSRRLVYPILVLAVAGAIAWYGRAVAPAQDAQVRTFVAGVLANGTAGASEPFVVDRLRSAVQAAGGDPIDIEVVRGDPEGDGSATHVAVLRRDGRVIAAVRVRYDADLRKCAVQGVALPE